MTITPTAFRFAIAAALVSACGSGDVTDPTIDAASPDAPPPSIDAAPPCESLVVNGGFELPMIRQNTDAYSTDPSFLPGWKLSAGGNQFFLENGTPWGGPRNSEGSQAICLNGDGAKNVFVEQSFATEIGTEHTLRFFLTDEQVGGPSATAVLVEIAGKAVTFDRTQDTGYVQKSFTFLAASSTTTLRISDASPGSIAGSSPLIDDVIVSCGD